MSSAQPTQITGVEYIKMPQGICKIAEMTFSFIGVLLVGIGFSSSTISFFESAASISIIVGAILFALYVSGYVAKIPLQWNRVQFIFNSVFFLYYVIAVALVLHDGSLFSRLVVGGVFGLLATLAHLADAFFNYKIHPLF